MAESKKKAKKPVIKASESPTPKKDLPHSWKNPKYRPEMCDEIIEYYQHGAADVQICRNLGICRDTFYEWVKNRPEFARAVKVGKQISEAWWIDKAQDSIDKGLKLDSKVWNANMKNRFGWRDNRPEEVTREEMTSTIKDLKALVELYKSKEKEY